MSNGNKPKKDVKQSLKYHKIHTKSTGKYLPAMAIRKRLQELLDVKGLELCSIWEIIEKHHELVIKLTSLLEMKELTHLINSSNTGLSATSAKLPPAQLVVSTRDENVTTN